MTDLMLRNLEIFFRDKSSVIMSLLAEVIIMVLYIMFMRDNLITSFDHMADIDMILDSWMIAGILGITPLTASMGAYGIMVEDKANKKDRDFIVSPISDTAFIIGYFMCAVAASVILSLTVLLLAEIYMFISYGSMAGAGNMVRIYCMIGIESLCCSAMVLLPVSFLKSSNALAGCCTILGALIGFMTGIYLPVGSIGESVAMIIKAFPVSHGVSVFRQLLTIPIMEETTDITGKTAEYFTEYMGICFDWKGTAISQQTSVYILLMTSAIFLISVITVRICMRKD